MPGTPKLLQKQQEIMPATPQVLVFCCNRHVLQPVYHMRIEESVQDGTKAGSDVMCDVSATATCI